MVFFLYFYTFIGECYAKIGTSTAMRVRIQIGDEAFAKFTRMKDDKK